MEVTLYTNFRKRHNSTKQPTDGGTTKDLKLKDNCSKINPMFFIADVEDYTYLKAWGNYYFIDNASVDINGAQYISCSLDYLATYKTPILNESAFVSYSSSNYDVDVIDSRPANEINFTTTTNTYKFSCFSSTIADNTYIISTANGVDGLASYALSQTAFYALIESLVNDESIWATLGQYFGDANGSILGARYVPVPYSYYQSLGYENEIYLGTYNTGIYGIKTTGRIGESGTVIIPWHFSDYRRVTNTTLYLLLPFIGKVPIPTDAVVGGNSISVTMVGNTVTGKISYSVQNRGRHMATYSGNFGMQVPIANSQIDVEGLVSGTVVQGGAVAMGAVASNPVSAVAAASSLIAGVVQTTMSLHKNDYSIVGGLGGNFSEQIIGRIFLVCDSLVSRTDPSELTELYGRPCMKVLQLSTLSGYVETIGFSLEVAAMDIVRTTINSMLDSGIYIE